MRLPVRVWAAVFREYTFPPKKQPEVRPAWVEFMIMKPSILRCIVLACIIERTWSERSHRDGAVRCTAIHVWMFDTINPPQLILLKHIADIHTESITPQHLLVAADEYCKQPCMNQERPDLWSIWITQCTQTCFDVICSVFLFPV